MSDLTTGGTPAGLEGLLRRTDEILRIAVCPMVSPDPGARAAHQKEVEALLAGPVVISGADLLRLTEIAKHAMGVSWTQVRGWESYREESASATEAQLKKMARENKRASLERLLRALAPRR